MKHYTILGKLQTKYLADFEDPNNIIISMNNHNDEVMLPRTDLWFDLHEIPTRPNCDFTKENFPFEQCHNLVGRRFYSTMAYMIAWCILQGCQKLSIYGCKYTDDGNPRRQRELHNVREMLFYCMGKGIELEICEEDLPYLFPEHIPDDGQDFDQ